VTTIGQKVKSFRHLLNLTIPQLAEITGLSKGFISQVENDKASLSIDSLQKIAEALKQPIRCFLEEPPFQPELIKKDARHRIKLGENEPVVEILSSPFGRQLQMMMMEVPVGYQTGDCSHSHEGEEWIFVLSGIVRVTQGEFSEILEEGDSIHIDGSYPHICQNASSNKIAKIIAGVTPPAKFPITKIE
jgi:transcriptional regulator with XRE-family HTH domain